MSETSNSKADIINKIYENLRKVVDPEIGFNIIDLGLVYNVDLNMENDALIKMTLTAPNCPFADMILMETEFATRAVPGVNLIDITLTFDPPWTPDRVTEEIKAIMGLI